MRFEWEEGEGGIERSDMDIIALDLIFAAACRAKNSSEMQRLHAGTP